MCSVISNVSTGPVWRPPDMFFVRWQRLFFRAAIKWVDVSKALIGVRVSSVDGDRIVI